MSNNQRWAALAREEATINTQIRITSNDSLNLRFLAKQILLYAPAALIPAVFGLLSSATFTRVFSTAEYGAFSLIVGLTDLFAALYTQWLQQGITRYLPGEHDEAARSALKRATAWALLIVGSCALVVSMMVGFATSRFVDTRWQPMVWAAAGLVVVTALFNPVVSVLQGEMRAGKVTAYQSMSACLRFCVSLLLVLAFFRSPASLIWAGTCALGLLLPFMWRDARLPSLPEIGRWADAVPSMRRLAAYGFPMMGWFISSTVLSVGDRYILQYFRGSTEVGIYAANYSLVTGAVGLVTAPVLLAAHPFLMRAWGSGNRLEAGRWLGLILSSFATVGTLLIGVIWLLAGDVAKWLLGTQFHEGYRVMPVVFAGLVVWQLGLYLHKPLEFNGKTRLMFAFSVVCGIFNILLNVMFVPTYGYIAAAYSTVAAYAMYALLVGIASRRILPWHIHSVGFARTVLPTIVMLILVAPLRSLVEARFGYISGLVVLLFVVCIASGYVLLRLITVFTGTRS